MRVLCLAIGISIFLWGAGIEAKGFQFPEVTGWKQSGEVQTFEPKTLYEYINGAADLYLACDFEELKVAEYTDGKKAQVTVEIYRHKTPIHAFGIYSQERLPESNFIPIGAQGYIDKDILNFLAGSYYIKMSSYNTGNEDPEVLRGFAKKVAENLGEKSGLPSILSSFPRDGKKSNSEKLITKNFLGYSFMPPAFTAEYEIPGKKFRLFLMETGDKNECGNMIQKYLQQIKNPEKEVKEGRYTLSDPHHGAVDLSWKGKYVWGALDLAEPDLRTKYLSLFEEGLKK
jgi:hypothetical protein